MPFETLKTMVNVGKNICSDLTVPVQKSLEKNENFETRFYEKNRYVVYKYKTIDSKNPDKNNSGDDPVMKNVWRLMKYTQGENDKKKNMKLYMPVFVFIETIGESQEDPEGDVECEVRMMVSLPPEYQGENADIPMPNDPELFIDVLEGFKCYVRTFSGFANEKIFKTETEKLRISLNEVDIKHQKSKCICIAYDPPYKAFNRRNEF
ncbi:heme-binding 2-like [Brachionus plicatilis]|uniref:Heme-binding 2-like n=1 Tax=Brachionus plicatilis TaxID=10195 RepID=A0A3M7SIZ7_BRAPC|nr:heme-binding 2-like [Brachionus plicatilis]